ncbi:MAG: NnrS family protein, partial [Thiotrichaceae bacterium]|nr:NnrS family protein [Thiotrichaceae bacterium]
LLTGAFTLPSAINLTLWHAHEMLFGFSGAIIVGFLLTAVQNWTGQPGVKGLYLALLVLLWLLARLSITLLPQPLYIVTLMLELSWMPLAAMILGKSVLSVRMWRNLFFVPFLLVMALLNALSLYGLMNPEYLIAKKALWSMFFLVVFLVSVMGGRVIPFFTAKGTQSTKVNAIKFLDYAALMPLPLIAISFWLPFADTIIPIFAIISGAANMLRGLRWKILTTFKVPLLWSLHLSYLMLSLGVLLYGISFFVIQLNPTSMLHLTAISGIGGIILTMISRVSLGHTGHALTPSKWMSVAFILMILSGVVRTVSSYSSANIMVFYWISISLWTAAFILFLLLYSKILMSARKDKRLG